MSNPDFRHPIRFGEFTLDRGKFELRRGEEPIRLQPKTYDVLAYLVEHPGRVVKDDLVAAVWPGVIVTDHSLKRCIKDLRRALGDDATCPRYIETVARRGYRFLAMPQPVVDIAQPAGRLAIPMRARWPRVGTFIAILLVAGFTAVSGGDAPAPRGTENFDALQAFQLGHELLQRRPVGWPVQALAAFDRAIAHDRRFAAAHAGRAAVLVVTAAGTLQPRATIRQAQASVASALALDPGCALAHAALGFLRLEEGDPGGAERALRRAIELDPKLGNAWNWLATALARQGRRDEVLAVYQAGLRADPLHPSLLANIGLHYERYARYAEARSSYARLLQVPYPTFQAQMALVDVSMRQGRLAEALEHSLGWEARSEGDIVQSAKLRTAVILARLGFAEEARSRVDEVLAAGMTWRALPAINRVLATLGATRELPVFAARLAPGDDRPPWLEAILARSLILGGDAAGGVERLAEALARTNRLPFSGWGDDQDHVDYRLALAHGLQRTGRAEEARAELQGLLAEHGRSAAQGLGQTPDELALRALALGLAGRRDEALQALDLAVDRGWNDCFRAAHDPRWDTLRREPRFEDAMTRARRAVERERGPSRTFLASASPPK